MMVPESEGVRERTGRGKWQWKKKRVKMVKTKADRCTHTPFSHTSTVPDNAGTP